MYAVGFPGTPDLVVWPESSLNIFLWIKFKMAAIRQGNGHIDSLVKQMFLSFKTE